MGKIIVYQWAVQMVKNKGEKGERKREEVIDQIGISEIEQKTFVYEKGKKKRVCLSGADDSFNNVTFLSCISKEG